ncbi:uncharacterized protein DFL_001959 [Arthrobotrys flagrans]|uniref:H-type lectin domain-containing protein n=1 Tax=Arthrobotrys flagrans TaxID=97331 RepID=A0A437A9J9_ARTFL|nr:hypothetical protein DFL_001959 [Arthrobotrys flagrans]
MSSMLAPYNPAMRLGQGYNSFTQQICIDGAVIIDPKKAEDGLKRGGVTMKDITTAMRPPDNGRTGVTGRSDTPVPGLKRYIKSHAGSEASSSSSLNIIRMKSPPPIMQTVGGSSLSQSILDGYTRPTLSSGSLGDLTESAPLSPPGSWKDRERNSRSPFSESSISSMESRRRKGKGVIAGSTPTSSSINSPASMSMASKRRGSSPTSSMYSTQDESDSNFGLAKLRIRHGEPVARRDWGSASDGSVPGQDVRFVARFVNNLSDITEDMNISAARTIKRGRIDGLGGDSFIDVEKFKQADLNFYIRVRVTNHKIDVKDALQFNPDWVIIDHEFTECFGDTFISGFIDGGEFNALLSIRVLNKTKVKDIEAGVKSAFGNSLFTLDSLGKEEWERRDIDNSCEINVSAIWSGGGRIKSSEKQWPIHSLMEAAANFPDLVASEPHRTYAILTSYPYLRSFYKNGELLIPLAPYGYATQRTKALLDAYLDYKSLRQRLDEDIADLQNGDKVFQSKEYFRHPSVQLRRDIASAEDDSKFAPTIGELDQAIKAATFQMKSIMEEVNVLVKAPEAAMEGGKTTFQHPDVFRSRLPKLLPKVTKDIVARSAVVVQSDESELYLVSSGGSKANMMSGKFVPRTEEAENYHYARSYSFVKDTVQESSHIAKRIRNETQDQLPPRIFTGIRQLVAVTDAFTDPSLRFRIYSTSETAKGFDCCFHDWSIRQITSGTFDVLAVNRSDLNFLTGSVEGRGVREWSIKFSRMFRRAPEIVIWLTGVDINKTPEPTVDLEVRAITTKGFRILPKIPNPETWVSFSWLAYNPDAGGIISGFLEFGSRKHDYGDSGRVEFPPGTFSQRPRVLAALHGFALFPMTEDEQSDMKTNTKGVADAIAKGEIELEIGKTTMDGFNWGFRAAVPKGCKVVMQWLAVA